MVPTALPRLGQLVSRIEKPGSGVCKNHLQRSYRGSSKASDIHYDLCRHGEVSRAMRNRCIELCILQDTPSLQQSTATSFEESDLLLCLGAEGVAGQQVAEAMLNTHCDADAALTAQHT